MNFKRFLSLALAFMMVFSICPMQVFATEETTETQAPALPNAEVTVKDPITLEAGKYSVWNGSLTEGAEDLPLQIVMNFKAKDTLEEAQAGGYGDWLCDFKLTFTGLKEGKITADKCYLAGYYEEFGWIAIPTDGKEIKEGVEYPVVANYDATLNYEDICGSVKDFTAAIYVDPAILEANPDFKVSLALKMTDPEDESKVLTIGEPAVYDVADLLGLPDATVTVEKPLTLAAGEYNVWNGSLAEGKKALPLQAVMNFKAKDTVDEAIASGFANWKCDFYLTFDGMTGDSVSGEGSYLAGNYGDFGWIAIPVDGITVEKGVEYPVVSGYDANITYKQICDSVKDFTAALYINPETLEENPNLKVTLKLKMTNPDDTTDVLTIGEPAVYTAADLLGPPDAEVTELPATTLKADKYSVWGGGTTLNPGDKDLPLQIVMNFKTKDSVEMAKARGYDNWLCDFYLTFSGLKNGEVSGEGSYLAGNYGDFGWIAIPTAGKTVKKDKEYPIVSNYDATLNYKDICGSVKDFTAAIYINPAVLLENPDMTVTLKLKMTNPENSDDVLVIGEPAVYTVADLLSLPNAEVTVLDPITLTPEQHEYSIWNGSSLSTGTEDLPLQAVMNFKAKDTVDEARANGFANWKCDFYLTFSDMAGDSISGVGSYLAGNYGPFGWIAIPTDTITVEKNVEYPVVANYDANITYKQVCDSVKDFTAALYINPETLAANQNLKVTLKLKMTSPDGKASIVVGEPAVYTATELLAAVDNVAKNTKTGEFYNDVNKALSEAGEGDTVILLKNVKLDVKESLSVKEGTFDLNGYALEAGYVTSFGNIVDNSKANSGFLVVPEGRIMLQQDNTQLPVKTENGYVFIEVIKFNSTTQNDGKKFVFQPKFEEAAHKYMVGTSATATSIVVRAEWLNEEGDARHQDFVFRDEFVEGFIESYNKSTGNYGMMFTLTFSSLPSKISFRAVVVSKNNVEIGNTPIIVESEIIQNENTTINAEDTSSSALIAEGTIKAGTKLDGRTLALVIDKVEESESNITLGENETIKSVDVHIEGIADDNTVPAIITVKELASVGLNEGNLSLYHVENGETVPMTRVYDVKEVDAHNEFYYDPATGDVTMALATFSEVAVISDTENGWNGKFNYDWYDADATELTIANADQLAAFGAIVGGMNGQTQDSFSGKTVKLLADINLGDKESENNPNIIFYPIGYYNSDGTYEKSNKDIESGLRNFEGTFDGNGHTISNFYHNTWEMKGDHNWYDATLQYYRDGMGLFGKVYGGTVKNLTVDHFSSDGEIATTGVIAAYADGATFENIAITNCNPRVYNIGNGGIVGCVGWYAKDAGLKTTFKNITVDNSNKISALWGTYDAACGGIVGQYYPTSGQTSVGTPKNAGIHFENCHVSAQMDVYNDVCGNYQYYAYRYTGMLIGSVRENETIDGHVYPKMDGITASECTVHFGDWNDYYYCEIIDNTTASYTHDYQMSRLDEIKAINGTTITYLDGTTGTVPASGRANYVIVDYTKGHGTENATCYHFKDGAVWTHEMGGIQTGIDENGDGKDDLKEDKQHIYLEFNNLVTGDGWGVTTKAVGDLAGVTILDREVGNSVKKFAKADTAKDSYTTETTVTIGELFKALDKPEVEINEDAIMISVSPVGETSTAGGTYTVDAADWTQGTLTFSGIGEATITITDYYFCTPTTINVTIEDKESVEKFETKFTGDFLYRVGNQNAVKLDSLFKAKDGATINNSGVVVSVDKVDENSNVSGTFTANTDDTKTWVDGTIQFSGTGVVKVTIQDYNFCTPTELTLEVVDAKNATTATSATTNNVVLLDDCGFSSLEVSGGYTLYGNGFTMTCGSDSAALDMGYSFVTLNNGTLDNVQIICPNFDYAVLYKSNMTESGNRSETTDKTRYFNVKSGVMVSGNSQILNSRISGGRAAVNVSGGNVVIDNSRIELGAVANVLVGSANSLTMRDVTLVQKPTASTYDSSKTLMGFSVLFICDANGDAAPVTLEGELVQNAWIDESDTQYVPSAGASIISTVLGKTDYLHDLDGDGTNESLNLGFAYMPESLSSAVNATTITDNRTDKDTIPYDYAEVSILNGKTYVYSYKNTNGTADFFKTESEYVPNKYGDIITVTYSDTADGLEAGKSFGTGGWVYELNVDLDKLSGYALDFSKLSMSVNGVAVTDFKVNGNEKPTSPVAVTAGGTTYTLTATIDGKEYTATLKVTGTETSKESPSKISGPNTAGFGVAKSYGGDWSGAADVLTGVKIKYWSVAENKYIEYDFSDFTVPGNAGKLNGTNNYWEYTHTNNDFTLKVTNTVAIHSGKSVYGMPILGEDGKLYFTISSTNGYVGSTTTIREIAMQYEFTDNNGGEKLTFNHTFKISYSKNDQYSYSDLSGSGKLTKLTENSGSGGGGCVTPDTLVTLADGFQVRVDSLSGNEELLVWNLETGALDTAPILFIDSDPEEEFEIVHLYFSDGTDVKVIYEHGFWDYDLNKYVYLDENAEDYIGHSFAKQNGDELEKVELVDVVIETEVTTAWSPVTAGHLCYFVNGMLSMPGGVGGLFNIFEVDPETMMYDFEAMEKDIEKYGLFTYEEVNEIAPLSREMFEKAGGAYLKVSIGKGNMTVEDLKYMINRYNKFFE